ncbi:MAG TPA: FHA domain-containing protein, partial [Planctomycetota bacterium]|nr:FHA domain-containing protein [Planctomycetota bacterium]
MRISFEHLGGSRLGQRVDVESPRITVGRNPGSTIQFDPGLDSDVSGNHAEIVATPDGRVMLT